MECNICYNSFKNKTCLYACDHVFCKQCSRNLIRNYTGKCPMCRSKLTAYACIINICTVEFVRYIGHKKGHKMRKSRIPARIRKLFSM